MMSVKERALGEIQAAGANARNLPWIKAAKAYIGVKEIPGPVSEEHIARWLNNVKAGKSDETPWCAAFVNGILEECGYKKTGRANARSFLACGDSLAGQVVPGCIVIFWRGDKTGWQGHVGFVLEVAANGKSLLVRGGNQGNKVSDSWFTTAQVLGYRWPVKL